MKNSGTKQGRSPLSGFLGYLVSTVISVIAVIYLGYHFINGLGTELITEHALQATENNISEFDAYILRNETVVYSGTAGEVGYDVSDGARVRVGSPIASIYDSSEAADDAVRDSIVSLDRQIELLTESNNVEGLAASDTSALDARIDSYYNTIRQSTEQGEFVNLPSRRDELLTLLNKRQIVTGAVESYEDVIKNLKSQRNELTSTLNTVTETVNAPASGFFYSVLDGYESSFTPSAAV